MFFSEYVLQYEQKKLINVQIKRYFQLHFWVTHSGFAVRHVSKNSFSKHANAIIIIFHSRFFESNWKWLLKSRSMDWILKELLCKKRSNLANERLRLFIIQFWWLCFNIFGLGLLSEPLFIAFGMNFFIVCCTSVCMSIDMTLHKYILIQ